MPGCLWNLSYSANRSWALVNELLNPLLDVLLNPLLNPFLNPLLHPLLNAREPLYKISEKICRGRDKIWKLMVMTTTPNRQQATLTVYCFACDDDGTRGVRSTNVFRCYASLYYR